MTSTLVVIANTIAQSFLSANGALILGSLSAIGLMSFSRLPRWIEQIIVLPTFLPPLFLVSASLNFYPQRGFLMVVLVHSFINVGYVAIFIRKLFYSRWGQSLELAYLEGASSRQLLAATLSVFQKDLIYLWVLIFLVCFTSFTVPSILGVETLEVLIASTLRVSLAKAWVYASIEIFILIGTGLLLSRFSYSLNSVPFKNLKLFKFPILSLLSFVPILFLITGLMNSLSFSPAGLAQISILEFSKNSIELGLITGLGVLIFCALIAVFLPSQKLQSFILSASFPSSSLLSLLVMPLHINMFAKISSGLILLFTPFIFRWIIFSKALSLKNQWTNAKLLGASRVKIFFEITLPQITPELFQGAGFASLLACSDFSISSILSDKEWTLPLVIENLFSLYRMELATRLLWVLLGISLGCYFLFIGIGHGLYKKFKNQL